jgi:translation initiation factor eIF-2B subunit epsilon
LVVWKPLLLKMGRAIGLDEEVAMVQALQRTALQQQDDSAGPGNEAVRHKLTTGMAFRLLLQTLHDQDIVSEEAILSWAQANRNGEGAILVNLPPIQDFLEWLEDDSDEDSDDDGAEEDDEDDQ